MKTKSKCRRPAKHLAAYYVEPVLYGGDLLHTAPRKLLWTIGGKQRWREALDRAAQLLESIAGEMQDYYDERSDTWAIRDVATVFMDTKNEVAEIQAELDELRSNF